MEHDQVLPPWYEELRAALSVARRAVKNADRSSEWVKSAIQAARDAGWDGDDGRFWEVAMHMAELEGSLPQHPQQAYLKRETERFFSTSG